MLHKSRSKQLSAYKFAIIIPLLAAFVFAFNTKVVAQEKDVIVEVRIEKIEIKVDKNYTKEQMADDVAFMKERGIELKFKGVKRNSAGEITSIKASYNDDKGISGNYSQNSDDGIEPFTFRVTGEGEERSIGFFSGEYTHKSHSLGDKVSKKIIVEVDDDELHEGKHKKHKVIRLNSDGDEVQTWIEGVDGEPKEIRVEIKDGEKVIMIDGEEVSEKELQVFETKNKGQKIKIKVSKKEGKDGNVFILKDSDDDYDVEFIEKGSGAFFVMDTDKDGEPLFIVDGKEMKREDFKENMKPDQIESINVLKGESASKKYGDKAKHGVVEVTTKKGKN